MKQSWGALPEDWDAFSRIAAGDIWPCVSNPSIPRARSKLDVDNSPVGKDFAKVPSGINNDGEAHLHLWPKPLHLPLHLWPKPLLASLASPRLFSSSNPTRKHLHQRYTVSRYEACDKDGNAAEYGKHTHMKTVVLDCGQPAYVVGIREERDYNLGDELGKQAAAWLDQNHPDWRDPLAYWE